MRQIIIRTLIILTAFAQGCGHTSRVTTADKTQEDLRDVFILSILARDYLRKTDGRDFNLEKLVALDSLGRIATNFEQIVQVSHCGHIAIKYKFSNKRDYRVEFTEKEGQMVEIWKVIEKGLGGDFDGEIQFEYGERFHNFRKVIIKKR